MEVTISVDGSAVGNRHVMQVRILNQWFNQSNKSDRAWQVHVLKSVMIT